MVFCNKCKSEIGDYEKFCPHCGYPQQTEFGEIAAGEIEDYEMSSPSVVNEDIIRREIRTTVRITKKAWYALFLLISIGVIYLLMKQGAI